MTALDVPLALWEAVLWTAIPYFAVGYYKDAARSAMPLPLPNAMTGQLLHHVSSVHVSRVGMRHHRIGSVHTQNAKPQSASSQAQK